MTATEYVVLVDEQDGELGIAEKTVAHEKCLLHRAFSLFIFRDTPKRELLLQQRALHKYHSPGLWTNTCCSHPRPGETILAAGERRLKEELGLTAALIDLGRFHYTTHFANGLSENEIDHVLAGTVAADTLILPNPNEIHTVRWVTIEELNQELDNAPDQFTAWLASALKIVTGSTFNLHRE
jgi:isopentenyl-diphosphate delta-isomerase type 1